MLFLQKIMLAFFFVISLATPQTSFLLNVATNLDHSFNQKLKYRQERNKLLE